MGLDQYAAHYNPEYSEDRHNFFYWRKHPNLQGWMENLYHEKGGTEEVFNCVEVELTLDDLDRLEKDIKEDKLPYTCGFFFGQSYKGKEETKKDLEFVSKARAWIESGDKVCYSSWW
jgi:hypothetical protein